MFPSLQKQAQCVETTTTTTTTLVQIFKAIFDDVIVDFDTFTYSLKSSDVFGGAAILRRKDFLVQMVPYDELCVRDLLALLSILLFYDTSSYYGAMTPSFDEIEYAKNTYRG